MLFLDGTSLTTDDLRQLGRGRYKIKLTKESEHNVIKARNLIEKILKENKGKNFGIPLLVQHIVSQIVSLKKNIYNNDTSIIYFITPVSYYFLLGIGLYAFS